MHKGRDRPCSACVRWPSGLYKYLTCRGNSALIRLWAPFRRGFRRNRKQTAESDWEGPAGPLWPWTVSIGACPPEAIPAAHKFYLDFPAPPLRPDHCSKFYLLFGSNQFPSHVRKGQQSRCSLPRRIRVRPACFAASRHALA